eukprot:TRINITY_DN2765_c0_g3_i1.p1 TRINITY_DN2765_c0_g3~~TRINITY_DN2765_c0_g3_i1.p1  ORF type:complete len:442 (+),score=88.90 TRINITY_DN2765_c0_g3_i1:56-1327(+)
MAYPQEHQKGEVLEVVQTGKKFIVGEYQKGTYDYEVDLTAEFMGMEYLEQDNQMYIIETTDGLPAAMAGVPEGSKLVAVEGIPVEKEKPAVVLTNAKAEGKKTITLTVRHEVGYVPHKPKKKAGNQEQHNTNNNTFTDETQQEGRLDKDGHMLYGRRDSMTSSVLEEYTPFVRKMMSIFDKDKDGVLNYKEYYEMLMAWEVAPPAENLFTQDFPTGFTPTQLAVDLYNKPDNMMELEEKVDRYLKGGKSERSESLGSYYDDEYDDDDYGSSYLSESYAESMEDPFRTENRPIPSVWNASRSKGRLKGSIIHADLRADSNEHLKRTLIKCARELERRHLEVKEAHDVMERGLRKVNSQAVKEFGYDLNTLLTKPSTHQRANSWAAHKMQQIRIPPAALYSYHQHVRGRRPPPSASSASVLSYYM